MTKLESFSDYEKTTSCRVNEIQYIVYKKQMTTLTIINYGEEHYNDYDPKMKNYDLSYPSPYDYESVLDRLYQFENDNPEFVMIDSDSHIHLFRKTEIDQVKTYTDKIVIRMNTTENHKFQTTISGHYGGMYKAQRIALEVIEKINS